MTVRSKAELFLFATTFIWGSTFVIVRLGVNDFSPSLFIGVRFGIGALCFLALFFKHLRVIKKTTFRKGIILGAMLGFGIVIQNWGIYQTTASKAGFITGLMVLFTPLVQLIIEHRSPKSGNVIGIVIVTIGLYLLTSPSGSSLNFGDFLVLLSALIFGIFIVYLDIFSKDENTTQLAFLQIASTSLVGWIFVPFETPVFNVESNALIRLLYMGILATVVTTFVQTRYQKETTPTRAVIIFSVEPVISAVLAYFFLNEILGVIGVLGGGLIVIGILISEFSETIAQKIENIFSKREVVK
ncbi:MAG: DMT family transporter [Bacteroidota bacterium]|nr:DMT family transporter [Bacteroidota bacterium]